MPATAGALSPAAFTAPGELGRYGLRARLVSATGQTLAQDAKSIFVVDGELTLAVRNFPPIVARVVALANSVWAFSMQRPSMISFVPSAKVNSVV